jgi:hypothetical protein
MDIIKGKRYSFYMKDTDPKSLVTALYTGAQDERNGNYLFIGFNNIIYSVAKEDIINEMKGINT